MSDLNSYSFTGRLGAPADLKYTQGGTAIWSARVAVGFGFGDKKGTNWITVKVFGKRAESLGNLGIDKGAMIGAAGELQFREFDKNDGSKGWAIDVTTQDVALLSGKPQGAQSGGGRPANREPRETPRSQAQQPSDDFDSDTIPFAHNRSII